jgi:hypothetical protein
MVFKVVGGMGKVREKGP